MNLSTSPKPDRADAHLPYGLAPVCSSASHLEWMRFRLAWRTLRGSFDFIPWRLSMRSLLVILLSLALTACAGTGGLGSVTKTTQLQSGMTEAQVQQLMGKPASVQQGATGAIWKYSLHEYYKGWVNHYLLFAGEPRRLQEWAADEAQYQRSVALWVPILNSLPSAASAAGLKPSTGAKTGNANCNQRYTEDRMACLQAQITR